MKKSTNLEPYTKKIAQYTHEFVSGGTGNFDYNNIEAIIKKLNETKASDHKASAVLITKITKFLINSAKQVSGLKYNLLDSICEHASKAVNDIKYNEDLETLKKLNEAFTQDDNLYTYDINGCKHDDDNIRKYVYTLQLVSGLYLIFTKQEKYLPADAIKPAIPIIKFKKDYLPDKLLTANKNAFKEIYKNIKKKLRKDLPVVVALGDEKLEDKDKDKDKEKELEDKDKDKKKKEVLDKIYEKEKEISLIIEKMFDFTKFEKVSKILVYRNTATEFVDSIAHHTKREEAILQELTNIRDDIYFPVDEIISKYFEYNFDLYNWELKNDALNNTLDDINKSLDELTKIYDRLKEQSNEKILGILTNFELGNDDKIEENDETKKNRYLKEITELIIIRIKFIKKIEEFINKIVYELPHIGIMIDVNESDEMVLRENDLNDEDINPTEKKALETLIDIFNERYLKMLKNSKEIFIKYFVDNENENDSGTLLLKDTRYYATIPLEQFENDLVTIKTYDIDSLNTDMFAQYKIIIDNEEIKRNLKSIDEKYEGIANHKFTNYKISRTDINREYMIEKKDPDLQLTRLRNEIGELNRINRSLKVTFDVYTGFKELVKKHQEEENTEENTENFKEEIKEMDNYIQQLIIKLINFEPYNENNDPPMRSEASLMRGSVVRSEASLMRGDPPMRRDASLMKEEASLMKDSVVSSDASLIRDELL